MIAKHMYKEKSKLVIPRGMSTRLHDGPVMVPMCLMWNLNGSFHGWDRLFGTVYPAV